MAETWSGLKPTFRPVLAMASKERRAGVRPVYFDGPMVMTGWGDGPVVGPLANFAVDVTLNTPRLALKPFCTVRAMQSPALACRISGSVDCWLVEERYIIGALLVIGVLKRPAGPEPRPFMTSEAFGVKELTVNAFTGAPGGQL